MSWLANLGGVMIHPRRTMRRILDAPRDRKLVVLVLLATISGLVGDISIAELQQLYSHGDTKMRLLLPASVLAMIVLAPLIFYAVAWLAFAFARALEGTADIKSVRRALAWGLAPIIWALLYRVPAMFLKPAADLGKVNSGGLQISLDGDFLASGCGMALLFGLLDLATLIWWAVVTSNTLAEAEGFSALRGFGTLVLCMLAPVVITVAAVLAIT